MDFFQSLLAAPPQTPLSRYTTWNGVLYLGLGLSLFAWPGAAQALFFAEPFEAGEEGMVRVIGFSVMVIGWFYVMGGRTAATSFGLATVADRFVVPFFLLPLALTGAVDPHLVVPFAVLDPALAVGAFLIWRRQGVATSAAPVTGQ